MADVEVTPPDLKFSFQTNKQLLATININNLQDQKVAFKVLTTSPKKYVVRPSWGVVEPRSSLPVQVIMHAQRECPQSCRDKFMVPTLVLAADEEIDKDKFNKDVGKVHKMRVVVKAPGNNMKAVSSESESEQAFISMTGVEVNNHRQGTTAHVEIAPSNLRFKFQSNQQLQATITITNKGDQQAAFKVKVTDPLKYVVRPSSGVVDPRSSKPVQIVRQRQMEFPQRCKDKFLIQTTPLAAYRQIDEDTFRGKDVHERKIAVIIEAAGSTGACCVVQ